MHMQLASSFRIPFTTLLSYIPVIATIVTTFFSIILARATLRYVEATDKGLALAREEFEREWSPDLHIKMERVSASEARIIVTNLAKTSVLLQLLQLRLSLLKGIFLHQYRLRQDVQRIRIASQPLIQ